MRPILLGPLTLALLLSRPASAETIDPLSPEPRSPAPENQPDPRWYGWQLFVVDAASLATGAALAATLDFAPDEQPSHLGLTAASWYGLGAVAAPAVHYAHGNTDSGFASLSLRLLVPPAVGLVGALSNCGRDRAPVECEVNGFGGGTLAGLAGVAVLDAAVLARERPRPALSRHQYWYGGTMLIIDGAAIGLGAFLGATGDAESRAPEEDCTGDECKPTPRPAFPFISGYIVGLVAGPVVHFAHGNVGKGFISLGARALAPILLSGAGVLGYCTATAGVTDCSETGQVYGLLGGLAIVDIFDALVLAHDDVEPTELVRYAPSVNVGPNSLTVGGYF